jgi:hypothetical protein
LATNGNGSIGLLNDMLRKAAEGVEPRVRQFLLELADGDAGVIEMHSTVCGRRPRSVTQRTRR